MLLVKFAYLDFANAMFILHIIPALTRLEPAWCQMPHTQKPEQLMRHFEMNGRANNFIAGVSTLTQAIVGVVGKDIGL